LKAKLSAKDFIYSLIFQNYLKLSAIIEKIFIGFNRLKVAFKYIIFKIKNR
jgi:hypothetical protein